MRIRYKINEYEQYIDANMFVIEWGCNLGEFGDEIRLSTLLDWVRDKMKAEEKSE